MFGLAVPSFLFTCLASLLLKLLLIRLSMIFAGLLNPLLVFRFRGFACVFWSPQGAGSRG